MAGCGAQIVGAQIDSELMRYRLLRFVMGAAFGQLIVESIRFPKYAELFVPSAAFALIFGLFTADVPRA